VVISSAGSHRSMRIRQANPIPAPSASYFQSGRLSFRLFNRHIVKYPDFGDPAERPHAVR
jgi:hypothetical protein